MLFAVRIGEQYRPTRDLDLLGMGAPDEAEVTVAVRERAGTLVDDDGIAFDADSLEVYPIREDDRYGGIRVVTTASLAEARIHVQIDIGFGDVITPSAVDLHFPTLLLDMPSPNVLAYPTETIVAEKTEAIVDRGISNSRMKDFTDIAMAARRVSFGGDLLAAAIRATFRRRGTPLPDAEIVGLSDRFVQDASAQANWNAYARRSRPTDFESLSQVVDEIRAFLQKPMRHARTGEPLLAKWEPGGPWI